MAGKYSIRTPAIPPVESAMSSVDRRPARHPRPRTARGEPVSRPQPAGRLAARVRRPGDRPGAGRGHAAPSRAIAAAFAARLFPARPAIPKVPIIYEVDRIRDGKSFTTRRVVAIQHGQRDLLDVGVVPRRRAGPRPSDAKMPDVPQPDAAAERRRDQAERSCRSCPSRCGATTSASGRSNCGRSSSAAISARSSEDGRFNIWIRTTGAAARRSGDPSLRAGLCLRHDAARHRAACRTGAACSTATSWRASLDHALWFHRPFRADEWLLYAQDSPNLHGSRGFARGLIFAADGTLVASVAQEGLLRRAAGPSPTPA